MFFDGLSLQEDARFDEEDITVTEKEVEQLEQLEQLELIETKKTKRNGNGIRTRRRRNF